jgi:glutamyl-tRNA reductase
LNILLTGLNHKSAPVEIRERFALDDPGPALAKLVRGDEIHEAVLVSTCNRVEVVALAPAAEVGRLRLRSFFGRDLGGDGSVPEGAGLPGYLYEYRGPVAMQHVFRVTSSIDSLVVGEPQILGQMKEAYRQAVEAGTCGPILSRLFQRAFATAKRVRNETGIAERPVSMARVAVSLARQIFEDLSGKSALLVGAGEMIELALEALRAEGLASACVANRSVERAQELAGRFGASAHALAELPALLAGVDIVLTCIGGDGPLLSLELLEQALHRRSRPLFVIDLGVPRNVDPSVDRLENVYRYDLDDLSEVAEENAATRRRETLRAEAIVLEEQQRFDGWLSALQAVPTIRDLRQRADSLLARELDRQLPRLGLSEAQREGVEMLSRSLVNKLLHAPISRLRAAAEDDEGLAHLEAARLLFGLDEAADPAARLEPEPGHPSERDPEPE